MINFSMIIVQNTHYKCDWKTNIPNTIALKLSESCVTDIVQFHKSVISNGGSRGEAGAPFPKLHTPAW